MKFSVRKKNNALLMAGVISAQSMYFELCLKLSQLHVISSNNLLKTLIWTFNKYYKYFICCNLKSKAKGKIQGDNKYKNLY